MGLIQILGVEGAYCNITPTTKGLNHTEIYSKSGNGLQEYIGCIILDKHTNRYVLYELHPDYQMSLDCIKEAFELTEKYWKPKHKHICDKMDDFDKELIHNLGGDDNPDKNYLTNSN